MDEASRIQAIVASAPPPAPSLSSVMVNEISSLSVSLPLSVSMDPEIVGVAKNQFVVFKLSTECVALTGYSALAVFH